MSGAQALPRQNRLYGLLAAVALHAGLLLLLTSLPAGPKLPPVGSSVPINIVSSDTATDSRPAVQAPQTVAAATPEPTPQAKPQPAAPQTPLPSFTPTAATPPPKPVKATPAAPGIKPAAQATPAFDFDRMQKIIDSARKTSGQPTSSAPKGPARQETAPQSRPDAGTGVSQSDLAGLTQLLERLWRLDCETPGIAGVNPQVKFTVGLDGHVVAASVRGDLQSSGDPIVAVGARRAIDAVRGAAPYPEPYYGQTITVNFNAKEACAKK